MATVTPFRPDGELDTDAVAPLFDRLLDAGVDGVFVNGTTGEFVALDDDERETTVAAALDVFGSGRVIAHIGAADARHAGRLARRAVDLGAQRLAAITPYYLPSGPRGLRCVLRVDLRRGAGGRGLRVSVRAAHRPGRVAG